MTNHTGAEQLRSFVVPSMTVQTTVIVRETAVTGEDEEDDGH
jgi:hypothetical protein